MEKPRCSLDSYDAIHLCECKLKLCPIHYFSHIKEYPAHEINRIKIEINNDSKQIIIDFIIWIKKWFTLYFNQFIEQCCDEEINVNYICGLKFFNEMIFTLNKHLRFIMAKKSISMKLILNPIEYFLVQPPSKTMKFAQALILPNYIPEDIEEREILGHLTNFNYFRFEDIRYIHGYPYYLWFDKESLLTIIFITLQEFIKAFEYEMAFELIQNLDRIKWFSPSGELDLIILRKLNNIIYKLIEKKSCDGLIHKLEEIEVFFPLCTSKQKIFFYTIFALMLNLNNKDLAYDYIKKTIIIRLNYNNEREVSRTIAELGNLYFYNLDYKAAASCFKTAIKRAKKSFSKKSAIIIYYFSLVSAYYNIDKMKNSQKIVKIVKIVENMESLYNDKSKFFLLIWQFYIYTKNFNKAIPILWKCIKYIKTREKTDYYTLSDLYYCLALAYMGKDDASKVHKALSNAKSCFGILPIGGLQIRKIYLAAAEFYNNQGSLDDALWYFQSVEKYFANTEKALYIKYNIGFIYFMKNNEEIKALNVLIDTKKLVLCFEKNIKAFYAF